MCYVWILDAVAKSHLNIESLIFPGPNWCNHYLTHSMFWLHNIALPVCTQHQRSVFLPLIPYGHVLGLLQRPLPCPVTPWIQALILVYPSPLIDWLINYMVSLTVNWNSSQLWSFHHRKMFPSQPCAQGVLSIFVTCLPKDRLAADKRFLRSINLDLPILDRATLRQFLLLGFFSPPNHRMRFL
jgi:hypothetical protein